MINPEYVAEALLEAEDNEPVIYKAESRNIEEHDYVSAMAGIAVVTPLML
jgi:CO dehydrogenase/acetyl-CoA synthase gamma subunit (corrinoid Fe-S protein)